MQKKHKSISKRSIIENVWTNDEGVTNTRQSKPVDMILWTIMLTGFGIIGFDIWRGRQMETNITMIDSKQIEQTKLIWVDVGGAVNNPGVYQIPDGSRLSEVIDLVGGVTAEVDKELMERSVNLATIVTDGQKIYIPSNSATKMENSLVVNAKRVSLNTSSQYELEQLNGIGEVRAKKIIDERPYTSFEDAIDKGVITESIREKNRDLLIL